MHVSRAGADTGAYLTTLWPNTPAPILTRANVVVTGVGGRLFRESYRVYDTYCSE